MTKKSENTPSRLRSFGRISSHMSSDDLTKLEKRLAMFTLDVENISRTLNEYTKCIVEIGIGNGELIAKRAKAEPNTLFIANEVFKNGLKSLVVTAEKEKLSNLRIHTEDGRELLEALPKNSVDELVVLYPDPWPKKKHNKRRIINEEFLKFADKVLKEDGTLFLATDIPDYALWMLREVYTHGEFFPTATSPKQWSTPPVWWHSTKYERKAKQAGRHGWYMPFKRGVDKSNTKCERVEA